MGTTILLPEEFLYRQNEFLVIAMLLALLLIATEIGFRHGQSVRTDIEDSAKSHHWTLQAGVMGLLALLLAFTFSMSATRYETRRQLVVDEANAIGATYLRSRMLAQPYPAQVAQLIRGYVDERIETYDAGIDQQKVNVATLQSQRLETQLWSEAVGAAAANPQPVPTGLFISSLNEVIEIGAKRDAARDNHVPQPVQFFLFLVTILTLFLLGFGCGLGNHRNPVATTTVCLLISLAILVIMDLDRPRRGLITISQQPMLKLRTSVK